MADTPKHAPAVRVRTPRPPGPRFLVVGSAAAGVASVTGSVAGAGSREGVSLSFRDLPHTEGGAAWQSRWLILFTGLAPGAYTLTVVGRDAGGRPVGEPVAVGLTVPAATPPAARGTDLPTIDWPEPDYTIPVDEQQNFLAYGGSVIAVSSCTIASNSGQVGNYAPDNFWWATFESLDVNPGPGTGYLLDVVNADGHGQCFVDLAAP